MKPDTIRKWVKRGKLRAVRTGGGHHRISLADLSPFITRVPESPRSPQADTCLLRCWEYLSDRGAVREDCKLCVVYRVRAAWCFALAEMGEGIGHNRRFCQQSCQDCLYFQRVQGEIDHVLVISEDPELIDGDQPQSGNSEAGSSSRLELMVVRNGYEASAAIGSFKPGFVVVDHALGGDLGALLQSLASDPRLPGLKTILAVPRGARGQASSSALAHARIVKPFSHERLDAVLRSFAVETPEPPVSFMP